MARFIDLAKVAVAPQSQGGTRLYEMLDAAFDGFTLLRAVRADADTVIDFVCDYVNQIGAKLHIVAGLADGWGHAPLAGGGKTVWFELHPRAESAARP